MKKLRLGLHMVWVKVSLSSVYSLEEKDTYLFEEAYEDIVQT